MSKVQKGLGRGLNALLASATVDGSEPISMVATNEIVPNKYQPRRVFDEEALEELTQSVMQYGVIQPVVVRRTLSGYELVAGERRWRAACKAGLEKIPAVIKEYTDGEITEVALIENIQRQDLSPIEEAHSFQRLIEQFGLTQEEVAKKIGRSRSLIANTIRLLNLHPIVQEHVSRGTLTMGQVRPLLGLESQDKQLEAAQHIIEEGLSARDVEALVKKLSSAKRKPPTDKQSSDKRELYVIEAEDKLKLVLGTQVKIKPGKVKSRIEIEFYSDEDLERLIEVMASQLQVSPTRPKGALIV